ncbi:MULTISPECIES: LysR family transcriptional regulator [Deefgea]|uniref:LysR family transcriptional regulator n=1 Tax=Deefgea chitinilytica TaxID=570276 RepID=A0ABS2CER9_9NEIS|nr:MULTISPECIES: LysR family transcriptional regulator [Deefgea]MBM5572654.1 LysR family transcriptional regulator [Deefgea chitinilytica]MBM9889890.1 LysR family transcriptional regulator [Deefgea sp. CFH1-16]
MLKMTLRELEVFCAINRTGGVTAAADALGLSQSAASGALAELERRLGVNLFDRIGRRVVLNEHGRYLLPRAEELLGQAQTLEENYNNGAPSRLNIAASLTIGNFVLPGLLGQLMQARPEDRYDVAIGNSQQVIERLLDSRADIGLIEAPITHRQLVSERWLSDEMTIFARFDHPLVGQTPSLSELAATPWIMREPGSGVRKMLEAMLLPHLGGMNLLLELGSGEAVREAVRLGLGISCGSKRAIAQELERGEFAAIPLPNIPMERRFYIVWHAEKRLTAGAERLRTACHAMMNNPP